jgi:hypothetical protein
MKKSSKQLIFERMGLGISSPKFTMQQEVEGDAGRSQGEFKGLISTLQDAYYQTGYFPVPTPEGGIRFIENDQEFDAYIEKVRQSWNEISLPF